MSFLQDIRALLNDAVVEVKLQALVLGHLRCQLMELRLGMCVPGACVCVDEFTTIVIARRQVKFAKASRFTPARRLRSNDPRGYGTLAKTMQ